MIGIDTNVLVRYFAEDDAAQAQRAVDFVHSLTKENPGYISTATLVETVWVMRSSYRASRSQVLEIIDKLLRTEEFVVEKAEIAAKALERYSTSNADFSDCLIERSAHAAGCSHTVTFDEQAAKATGMRLVR